MGKLVVVVGGGPAWEKEWNNFLKLIGNSPFDVALINDHIETWQFKSPKFAFTLHSEKINHWLSQRKKNGFSIDNLKTIVYANKPTIYKHHIYNISRDKKCKSGTSGFFAVYNLIKELGYAKVVLIGIPINNAPNYFRDEQEWPKGEMHRPTWRNNKNWMYGKVKSMGGWTKELLGEPNKRWLNYI